jgi:hypothetical protein
MKVPDEFRRFAVIGSSGMIEGAFINPLTKSPSIIPEDPITANLRNSSGTFILV